MNMSGVMAILDVGITFDEEAARIVGAAGGMANNRYGGAVTPALMKN